MTPADILAQYLGEGLEAKAVQSADDEAAKLGVLRGGTAGTIGLDGDPYGKCQRVAYLRLQGIQDVKDTNTLELFEAGYASEEALLARLKLGLPFGKRMATAAELDFSWTTANGTTVSGRPDGGVIDEATGKLDFGIEAKLAASLWTVRDVTYDNAPKSDHLIQAAHYSWRHGKVPFVLVYSIRSDYHLSTAPKWLKEKFKPGAPHVEFKEGQAFKIRPHTTLYTLSWDDRGRWCYQAAGAKPTPTQVTAEGIKAWYNQVAEIRPERSLPPLPLPNAVDGSKGYVPCKYCDWAPVCERTQDFTVGAWLDHIRTEVARD